jgi:hypothetical protein
LKRFSDVGDCPEHGRKHSRTVGPRLITCDDRGRAEKDAKSRTGRPVTQISDINILPGSGLLVDCQENIESNFIAPDINRSLKGQALTYF